VRARKLLLFFHCGSNTGYAIEKLERAFFRMAMNFTADPDRVHVGYTDLDGGRPRFLPGDFRNVIRMDTKEAAPERIRELSGYVRRHGIQAAFGFDQPVSAPGFPALRKGGIRLFVSYWGAPMSSLNRGVKLMLKRVEVFLRRNKPDHFIFESRAMADRAVSGRGIPASRISIIPTGVDTEVFKPPDGPDDYAHRAFGIPAGRKIFVYTGHMEARKGVHVIVEAANELVSGLKRRDVHFLLLGNRPGEEERFFPRFRGREVESHITFGGYRQDIQRILPACTAGIIASTGWDSFPMSALETAACGLPLVGSRLQGIRETIEDGVTGLLFTPGNHLELAGALLALLEDPARCRAMGAASRNRVIQGFSIDLQVERLTGLMNRLAAKHLPGDRRPASAALRPAEDG
jgi:glycosyltransferase involved in cell wall biosynthesis